VLGLSITIFKPKTVYLTDFEEYLTIAKKNVAINQ
jgi:hypothetical protein